MQCRGAKSFVDDLGLSRGVVLSRAAALLRSIETKPFDSEICPLWTDASPVIGLGRFAGSLHTRCQLLWLLVFGLSDRREGQGGFFLC